MQAALKKIVPIVSIARGIDYPMENNIFYNFPYKWSLMRPITSFWTGLPILIAKDSRLVVLIKGNKNSFGQINYGTEGDVSHESIKDAQTSLQLKTHSSSKIMPALI